MRLFVCLSLAGLGFLASAQTMTPGAKKYLDGALDTIQQNFYKPIDWARMREQAYAAAGAAKTPADTYPGIEAAIAFLHEKHSFFIPSAAAKSEAKGEDKTSGFWCEGDVVSDVMAGSPADQAGVRIGMQVVSVNGEAVTNAKANRLIFKAEDSGHVKVVLKTAGGESVTKEMGVAVVSLLRDPHGYMTAQHCAYVEVPAFIGEPRLAKHYTDTLQSVIRKLDAQTPVGWIVDLRRNSGGNMYPMIAGLGPVIGEGDLGIFLGSKSRDSWFYRKGTSGAGGRVQCRASHPYRLRHEGPRVVVLIGNNTTSSGEICAISFIGRPHTRFIGTATGNFTTGNDVFPLPDGSELVLTTCTDADRFGHALNGPVVPDEAVPTSWALFEGPDDPGIVAAEKWIATGSG